MTVHPVPAKRHSSDVAGPRLASAVRFREPHDHDQSVMIRRPWVLALLDPSDRDPAIAVTARDEFVGRDRRAA